MSAHPSLKLLEPSPEAESYKFDRRRAERHGVAARVTALCEPESDGQLARIGSLQLLDMSQTGMGALSDEALKPGQSVTILFPPHGPERGFDRTGHVVRCERKADGHRIGIRFAAAVAAA
ncbi:MAG: PilZ domain-containing protein [Phycisphaeraceae bacterium]